VSSLLGQCGSYAEQSRQVGQIGISSILDIMEIQRQLTSSQLADGLDQKSQGTAAEISNSLLSLTRKSVDDNATVIVVTLITLIYLPTQLVSVSAVPASPSEFR